MFCNQCGKQIEDNAKFCSHCGQITYNGIKANEEASPIARVSHRKRNWIIASAAVIAVALAAFGIWKIWFAYPTTPEGVLTAFYEAWQRGDDDAMCEYAGCEGGAREDAIEDLADHSYLESFSLGEMSRYGNYLLIEVELVVDGHSISSCARMIERNGKWHVDGWY